MASTKNDLGTIYTLLYLCYSAFRISIALATTSTSCILLNKAFRPSAIGLEGIFLDSVLLLHVCHP